ncbi:peroxidase [Streptomyces sp. NPDC051567]|uniref:peroxidase n=1 Tax=Streptomyces sp. NPDC051567 TaxID=3365660 RepID=UPI00379AFD6F
MGVAPPSCPDHRTHLGRRTVISAATGAAAGLLAGGPARAAAATGAPAATTARAAAPAADTLPLRGDRTSQGDVLAGFRKDHVCMLLLRFGDAGRARQWLARLLPEISTTEEVARFNAAFSVARREDDSDPVSLSSLWTGFSLTHPGLRLLAGREPFPALPPGGTAEAFSQGAAARAAQLGDTGDSAPATWLFGGDGPGGGDRAAGTGGVAGTSGTAGTAGTGGAGAGGAGSTVHAVLTLAADDPARLTTAVARHRDAALAADASVVFCQDAATLPGEMRGHEHFGFADSIGQPGVRGFAVPDPATGTTVLGRPGTRLLPPGEFLVGPEKAGQRPAGLPAWATGGSFQVVRRLAQDVPGWWEQIGQRLAELKKSGAAPPEATPNWLAARLVGRWPGGTPVAGCPAAEQRTPPGEDPDAALDYSGDPYGWRTPLFAHIRKANPRGGMVLTPGRPPAALAEVDAHRIIRRGIPYGPVHLPEPGPGHRPQAPRGLLFVCYQTDLVEQYEFIAKRWVNEPDFPPGLNPRVGADPVIGPGSPVAFETPSATGSRATSLDFGRFVRTEGALYAFTPSLPTLRALASGVLDDAIEIHPGTVLRSGDRLDAGTVRLLLDATGELALLDARGRRVWSAGTGGTGHDAVFSYDGELIVRTAAGEPLWSTGTARHPGARLLVRPSGDAVVLDGDRVLWRAGPAPADGGK